MPPNPVCLNTASHFVSWTNFRLVFALMRCNSRRRGSENISPPDWVLSHDRPSRPAHHPGRPPITRTCSITSLRITSGSTKKPSAFSNMRVRASVRLIDFVACSTLEVMTTSYAPATNPCGPGSMPMSSTLNATSCSQATWPGTVFAAVSALTSHA